MRVWACVLLVVVVVLLLSSPTDAKRKRRKSKINKKERAEKSASDQKKILDEYSVDEVKYSSKQDIDKAVKDMGEKILDDEEMTEEEYAEFLEIKKKEEMEAKKNVFRARANFGDNSKEVAAALHRLGKVFYDQVKFEDAFQVAKEVARIHTNIYGPNHEETAKALSNFGSVSCRMQRRAICDLLMYRVTAILIKQYGLESNQVLLQRGRMMTFHVPFGETHEGIDHDTFEEDMADALEELEDQIRKNAVAAKQESKVADVKETAQDDDVDDDDDDNDEF